MQRKIEPPPPDPEKAKRVSTELKRLSSLFKGVEKHRKDFIRRNLEQLAWLNISIIDLQRKIDSDGTQVEYNNGGGQSGMKTNPDLKTLVDYQKLATAIVRTLNSLIPIKEANTSEKKLMKFLMDDE